MAWRGRGLFSSSLAEYVVLSCLYFAKDVDRWKRNQRDRKWDQFCVSEVSFRYSTHQSRNVANIGKIQTSYHPGTVLYYPQDKPVNPSTDENRETGTKHKHIFCRYTDKPDEIA